ncbi:MAG: TetR/AcrR family transcriptional regulator [Candidatus Microbacterium colombiense]|nr:MAG: TetR/AcrR family transcriptional regulator [Microbacterium sp.]
MTQRSSERIPSGERREQILAAASLVFGERGYFGATTDQIAKAAGISQPYVVRMFGSKETLFIEVLARASDKLLDTFSAVIDEWKATGSPDDRIGRLLGTAYVNLVEDRGILLSLMQAFSMGHDAVIGAGARADFLRIYRLLREEAGFDPVAARSFLAEGMLLNTLLGLRLPEQYGVDEATTELLECTFQTKLQLVLDAVGDRTNA